jgi:ABC-type branched-subunit amino acid transport system ATPase component
MALMHQGGAVFPNLSVWQNLQLALGSVSRTAETQNFVSLQSVIPLLQKPRKELMRTMADKLSGGQRHELALAMTLSRRPKLVILDEPSAGLSPKAVEEMYGMLGEIRKELGITVLLIEQNVSHAVSFCSRCLLLNHGMFSKEFVGDNLGLKEIESVMFKN